MAKKVLAAPFPAAHGTMNNNELAAYRAQDSMSMVIMALHNPPIPVTPRAFRVFLAPRVSRMTIMSVRRMFSEVEIDRCGSPKVRGTGV